ncbi:hypothetical protein DPX16_5217 [Anabarilius grahami]|uniref:Uncharacterized protein n=1 Tax=Anabarilius grahami TaxID=495550 RepID=A0A3N0Y1B0_ANAGA|nr:hypothetical protein DPX16_5217 [Anabarilius grahami]
MSCHRCGSCRAPLHASAEHSECVACLGRAHTETALTEAGVSHCENMSLTSLRSRVPHASHTQTSAPLPVRAAWSCSGSEKDLPNDSMSLAASDAEDWSGSVDDSAPLLTIPSIPFERHQAWYGRRTHLHPIKGRRGAWFGVPPTGPLSESSTVLLEVEKVYEKLPPLEEAMAGHPSKPCRSTSALVGCTYTSAGQVGSAHHGGPPGLSGQTSSIGPRATEAVLICKEGRGEG